MRKYGTIQVRSRLWSNGICGGQSGAGEGFLRVLRFPLPIFIPQIADTMDQKWPQYKGLSPTRLAIKEIQYQCLKKTPARRVSVMFLKGRKVEHKLTEINSP
jgi:hypothetical protein